eukprot:m.59269 g.59269  ORF g.59269 m.59269 type:complete len:75 (+) comp13215_c1_seq2:1919-2143(+)
MVIGMFVRCSFPLFFFFFSCFLSLFLLASTFFSCFKVSCGANVFDDCISVYLYSRVDCFDQDFDCHNHPPPPPL